MDRIVRMPRKSRLKLPPLDLGDETQGERLSRLRKSTGLTQTELADRMGIIQAIVSAHELDKLKLSAEMAVRYAKVFKVSADELLGLKTPKRPNGELSRTLARRLKGIQDLPPAQQKALLKTIDAFLKSAEK